MEILCPECQFSREVDETKIPAKSQVATCPKCQTKFKFRNLPEDVGQAPVEAPLEQPAGKPAEQAPVAEPVKSVKPTPPAQKENESVFPKITAPGEYPKEGLWDKLGNMTPPDGINSNSPKEEKQIPLPTEDSEQQPVPGWTGEFNDSFPDPMQEEIAGDREEKASPLVPPPFEQLDRYGFFHGLYMTIKLILVSPRLFFSVMPVGGGLSKPLTFTILVTMTQTFIQYFWGMAGLSASVSPEAAESMGGFSGALAPLMMLLFLPAFVAAGQFAVTGIYHLLLIIMRADNKGFEGTFRALAYANAPLILGLFPMPMPEIEYVWMGVVALWGLYLTITGLKYIHNTSYAKVVPVALIPLLLGMIAALALIQGQMPTI